MPQDRRLERIMKSKLSDDASTLSPRARSVIEETIRTHCRLRDWRLLAVNVRTNHVHVVVAEAHAFSPEAVMSQFKAWCTRRLREAKLVSEDRRVWTEHGSTQWINDQNGLDGAIRYVREGQ